MNKLIAKERFDFKPFLTIVVIVMLTDTVMFTQNSSYIVTYLNKVSIVLLAIYSLFKIYIRRYLGRVDILCLISMVCIFSTMIVRGEGLSSYGLKACLIFISMYVAQCYSLELFAKRFVFLLRIIAIASLFTFVFGSKISGLGFLPHIISVTGKQYSTLFFSNVCHNALNRNFGPFWEPGAYQFYLIMAIVFSHFVIEKNKYIVFDTLLFSFAMVTTFSTTGIFALLAFYIYIILSKSRYNSFVKISLVLIVVAFGCYIFFNSYANELIFGKLSQGVSRSSVRARSFSMQGLWEVFKQNPIFGGGMEGTSHAINNMFGERVGITGFLLVNYAEFGFVYGTIQILLLLDFCRDATRNKGTLDFIFCLIIIFIGLIGESFFISLFVSCYPLLRRKNQDTLNS